MLRLKAERYATHTGRGTLSGNENESDQNVYESIRFRELENKIIY